MNILLNKHRSVQQRYYLGRTVHQQQVCKEGDIRCYARHAAMFVMRLSASVAGEV